MQKLILSIVFIITMFVISSFCSKDSASPDEQHLTGPYLGQEPPGKTPEKFAPGIITNRGRVFAITFSPDGRECYYTKSSNTNGIMFTK